MVLFLDISTKAALIYTVSILAPLSPMCAVLFDRSPGTFKLRLADIRETQCPRD